MINNIVKIENKRDLYKLINDIKLQNQFCDKFRFSDYKFKYILLKELKINGKVFDKKYFYYSKLKRLHIAESEDGSFLISTYGMIMYNKQFNSDKDKIVFAFESQGEVLEILLAKIEKLLNKKDIYDIDSYNYNYLMRLTTGLTNNLILFLELFSKSYISINNREYTHTHDLNELLHNIIDIMYEKGQNDTYFNAKIVYEFSKIVEILNSSDEKFIEHYVKYNDCLQPSFYMDDFQSLNNFVSICIDCIIALSLSCDDLYFKVGLYKRLLEKATTKEEKGKIKDNYDFLIDKEKLKFNTNNKNL